jgi:HEXXH motif-containing protein
MPGTTLRDWWKNPPTGTIHVGKGIDIVFNTCLNGTGIRLHSEAGLTTNRTRQENLLAEAAALLREVWPDIYSAFLALTDAIEFLDDPLQSVVSDRLTPGRMLLGTFAHDPLVAATELSHEVAHLYLYEKTRLGQIDDTAETQVFSPWKQTERPIYLTLHALTTYLSQSVFLARYTLDQGTMLPYVTATLGREIERLQIGARAFAEAVGSNMNSQTRDIIGAVEAFTDHAKAAC